MARATKGDKMSTTAYLREIAAATLMRMGNWVVVFKKGGGGVRFALM